MKNVKGITDEEVEWLVNNPRWSDYFDRVCYEILKDCRERNTTVREYKETCLVGLRLIKNEMVALYDKHHNK